MIKYYSSDAKRIETIKETFANFHKPQVRTKDLNYVIDAQGEWITNSGGSYRVGVDRQTGAFLFGNNSNTDFASSGHVSGAAYYRSGYTWLDAAKVAASNDIETIQVGDYKWIGKRRSDGMYLTDGERSESMARECAIARYYHF